MTSHTVDTRYLFIPERRPGLIPLVVRRITVGAEGIRTLELARADGSALPAWQPGAHIDVCISAEITRQYSLCGSTEQEDTWRISVLQEPKSRGGSRALHTELAEGDALWASEPKNNFPYAAAERYLFIAGGIGITPLLPMIAASEAAGAEWRLVYGGRSLASMAYREELSAYGDRVTFWPQDTHGHLDLDSMLTAPAPGTAIYCCGPGPLLDAVEVKFARIPETDGCRLNVERFRPQDPAPDRVDLPFTVICDYSNIEVEVGAGETILEAVGRAGVSIPSSCREGTCGTCETVVLEGVPDHRDSYLTPQERASNEVITPCCSRAATPVIVLDL